jgi:hypothetical protein
LKTDTPSMQQSIRGPASLLVSAAVLLCLLPSLMAQPFAGVQTASSSQTGRTIDGTVLNAATGRPLGNASVSLSITNEDRSPLAETITGPDGHFAFPQLRDGKYSLAASHRGFIPAAFDEHPTGSTAIVTGPGLVSTGLQFRLEPQAALYGFVTEDSGDPVARAQIILSRLSTDTGKAGNTASRPQRFFAEEDGSYEIANLAPGKYYIAVTGKPWYAVEGQSVFNVTRSSEPAGHPHSPLDVAYPTTYYPDATDQAYAAPIELAGGERVPVNFTLHPVPSIHITMQFQNTGTMPAPMPQISQSIFGSSEVVQTNISLTTPDSKKNSGSVTSVELSGFAPGQYDLRMLGENNDSGQERPVNLTSDQSLDISGTVPVASISGKITRLAETANNPAQQRPQSELDDGGHAEFQVTLTDQQGDRQYSAMIARNGAFRVANIRPGVYDLSVVDRGASLAFAQLSAAGATIEGHQVTIGSEPVTLSAKVVDATATIHGSAKLDSKPMGGIFLELVPMGSAGPLPRSSAMQTNQSDSDGSFDFPKVLPGPYIVLAIEEGWNLDYESPDALLPYLAHGLKITVPLHSRDIVLKDPVKVQPK